MSIINRVEIESEIAETKLVEVADLPRENYNNIVNRLSKQSVEKHFEAYVDIDWDSPDNQINLDDERWGLFFVDPLRESNWYKGLDISKQKIAGVSRIATVMRIGWESENCVG